MLVVLLAFTTLAATAKQSVYPDKPDPPRLMNDFAGMLTSVQESRLEHKLEAFTRTTSTQITVVTVPNLSGHEVADYSVHVFNNWGIGQAGKNNGVLLLVALDDRKAWITTGKGLEGVLTDAKSARIFRNELRPAFRAGDYYQGIDNSVDAIIAVTKNEYKADKNAGTHGIPPAAIILFIIFIIFIISMFRRGGGGGGGGYASGRGFGDFATGWLIGSMLSGGRNSGGWGGGDSWGGGGFGGGGFGGFGGGSSGGGGAGGSW